jgi:sugar phosphate isomerase/epimerase
MPRRLSFQLYSARKFPPVAKVLPMLAAAGYRDVEGYDGVYDRPEALRRALDRNHLAMPSGHIALDMLENDRSRVIALATILGMRHLVAPWLAEADRPRTASGWRKLGKRLAAIGSWARSEGFGFAWHNHDFEFARLPGGEWPLDVMFEAAPALDWEIDVAWVARAGQNPVAWIRRHANRITLVHMKDVAPRGKASDEDGWTEVGRGTIAWPPVMTALAASRAMHIIVEHDNPKDLAGFAQRSFAYAKAL